MIRSGKTHVRKAWLPGGRSRGRSLALPGSVWQWQSVHEPAWRMMKKLNEISRLAKRRGNLLFLSVRAERSYLPFFVVASRLTKRRGNLPFGFPSPPLRGPSPLSGGGLKNRHCLLAFCFVIVSEAKQFLHNHQCKPILFVQVVSRYLVDTFSVRNHCRNSISNLRYRRNLITFNLYLIDHH